MNLIFKYRGGSRTMYYTDSLEHYGVKGMEWGKVKKLSNNSTSSSQARAKRVTATRLPHRSNSVRPSSIRGDSSRGPTASLMKASQLHVSAIQRKSAQRKVSNLAGAVLDRGYYVLNEMTMGKRAAAETWIYNQMQKDGLDVGGMTEDEFNDKYDEYDEKRRKKYGR